MSNVRLFWAAQTATKQKVKSHYDLELHAAVMHDILDMTVTPEGYQADEVTDDLAAPL